MCKLSVRLRDLRKKNNLKQDNIAKILNTTQDTISLWELGKRKPNIDSLIILADFYDVSIDYLVGRKEY